MWNKRPNNVLIHNLMPGTTSSLARILDLSHNLGKEERKLAILGEGNTSTRTSPKTFLVKASGSHLGSLTKTGLTECYFDRLLPILDKKGLSDKSIDDLLFASRADTYAKKPSVEAIFHAYLLTLPGVDFVGHTHPVAVNQILCSKQAKLFATNRLFPDEIVCCGVESVFVPYTDPGLKLAQAIKVATASYIKRLSRPPRIILLENHGLIAIGSTPEAVLAATLMAVKSAEVFTGACINSGKPNFLTSAQIARIAGRPDEHYRQKALGL